MSESLSKLGLTKAPNRATSALDAVLNEGKNPLAMAVLAVELEEVDAVKTDHHVLAVDTCRDMLRALFITNEVKILNTESLELQRLFDLVPLFDEIHVMVLSLCSNSLRSNNLDEVLRVDDRKSDINLKTSRTC